MPTTPARPTYPERVYDALEPLAGALVLDGGAGTGIATRALLRRGARVVPFDIGRADPAEGSCPHARAPCRRRRRSGLAVPRLVRRSGVLRGVVALARAHRRCGEVARVLRDGGRWAGWWSHPRADGDEWFDRYWNAVEAACRWTIRSQRDTDWSDGVRQSGRFVVGDRITVPWVREVSVDTWLADERSKSYIEALSGPSRTKLLGELERIVCREFPGGQMRVHYETWLWTATKPETHLEPA